MKNGVWLIILAGIFAAGCISRGTPVPTPTPFPQKATATPDLSERPVAGEAQKALADWLDISVEETEVMRVEEVDWPDTSLGCPEPGMMYTQVIVPGYRVVMKAKGETYEYHTSGNGEGILCYEDGSPLPLP